MSLIIIFYLTINLWIFLEFCGFINLYKRV
jgi:hypothetical protein